MATGGVLGNGTKVGLCEPGVSPVAYDLIGQLLDIPQFIQLIAADVDSTVHSTSNIKTAMPGMIDPPEVQLLLLSDHDDATSPEHETLRDYQSGSGSANAGLALKFRIEVPVNRAQTEFRGWNFQAYVKSYSPSVPIDDKQTTAVTLKYTGGYACDSTPGSSTIS